MFDSYKQKFKKSTLLFIASLLTVQAISASELTEMSLEELLQVELFSAASMTPIEQHKAPGSVYSFTANDIERMGVRRLNELLEFVPGMQTSQYRKRHQSVTARGVVNRYNTKTLLLIDGRPQRHSYYGHYGAWDNFPIELINKVEIIMGPSSAIYGANAFAATISVTTKPLQDKQKALTSLELGNHSRTKLTHSFQNAHSNLLLSYIGQDAPYADDRLTLRGESPALQDLSERVYSIYGTVKLTENVSISADYQNISSPFVFILNDRSIEINERPLNLSANYSSGDHQSGRTEVVAYYNRDDVDETEVRRDTGEQSIESQDANIFGLRANRFYKYGNHNLAGGFEWRHDAADNMNVNGEPLLTDMNAEQNNFSLFFEDTWELYNTFNVTLGARFDDFDLYGTKFSPRIGFVYVPSSYQTLKFLHGEGIRTPTYREAFKVLDSPNFIAPKLEPEQSEMLELIYNARYQYFNFSISAYHNTYSGYITEEETPDELDEFSLNNIRDWHMQGLDLELGYKYGKHNLRSTVAYLDIEEKGTELKFPVANLTSSLEYSYQFTNKHTLYTSILFNNARNEYNDDQFLDDQADSFTQVNVNINGPLIQDWKYAVGVSNLFDETIYDSQADFNDNTYNNQRPEREFWLRLSRSF